MCIRSARLALVVLLLAMSAFPASLPAAAPSLITPNFAPARLVLAAGPICTVGVSGASYTTVQAAVNDPNCATINIAAGTYTENISISRSVILQGAGAASTILDGGRNGRVLNIPATAAQVQLRDMTIQHGNLQSTYTFGSAIYNRRALRSEERR